MGRGGGTKKASRAAGWTTLIYFLEVYGEILISDRLNTRMLKLKKLIYGIWNGTRTTVKGKRCTFARVVFSRTLWPWARTKYHAFLHHNVTRIHQTNAALFRNKNYDHHTNTQKKKNARDDCYWRYSDPWQSTRGIHQGSTVINWDKTCNVGINTNILTRSHHIRLKIN